MWRKFSSLSRYTDEIERKYKIDMQKIISLRKSIHQEAEIGFREYKTQQKIIDFLISKGAKQNLIRKIAKTGVIYDFGDPDIKNSLSICIRADIDALPQNETTKLPYSCKSGAAHSCGHDGHTVTLLTAAEIFLKNQHKFNPRHHLRLLFQPSEESFSGAEKVISEGGISNISEIYAFHNTGIKCGTAKIAGGAIFSGATHFEIQVQGKSTHSSYPENGNDPLTALSYIHTSMHTILSKVKAKIKPSCTVGLIKGGTVFNIIPEKASMEGSLRFFDTQTESKMLEILESITQNIPKSFGCTGNLLIKKHVPPVINAQQTANYLKTALENVLGKSNVFNMENPNMSSEDFAYYSKKINSAYYFLGYREKGQKLIINHNSDFDYNDKIIAPGALIWVNLVEQRFGIKF